MSVINHMLNGDLPRLDAATTGSDALSDLISSLTARFPGRRPNNAADALVWFRDARAALG